MKRIFGLFTALLLATMAMAQATPHERAVIRHDMVKERNARHAVARDVLTGHPARARANHRAAVAYHKKIHRDARVIHHNDVVRAKHRARRRY